jgi:hypothetical protein
MGLPFGALGSAHAVIDIARQRLRIRAHLPRGGRRPLEAMLQQSVHFLVRGQVSFRHGLAFFSLFSICVLGGKLTHAAGLSGLFL